MPQTKPEPIETFFESEFQRLLAKPSNRDERPSLQVGNLIPQMRETYYLKFEDAPKKARYFCALCKDRDPMCPRRRFY
jgi:hypothetical protein